MQTSAPSTSRLRARREPGFPGWPPRDAVCLYQGRQISETRGQEISPAPSSPFRSSAAAASVGCFGLPTSSKVWCPRHRHPSAPAAAAKRRAYETNHAARASMKDGAVSCASSKAVRISRALRGWQADMPPQPGQWGAGKTLLPRLRRNGHVSRSSRVVPVVIGGRLTSPCSSGP